MQAAVLTAPGRFEVLEVADPKCPPGGVVVEVKACGICSVDARMVVQGHRDLIYPRILGHEMAGVVVESQSPEFTIGDRVQVSPGLRCGTCRECQRGVDNLCQTRGIFGFSRDGGFAEYLPVPLSGALVGALTKLPENVDFALATLTEPLACCLNAQEKIGIKSGDTVLIIGAGPLGLLHAGAARASGATSILFSEVDSKRRQRVVSPWGDQVIDPLAEDLAAVVMELTAGKGADVLLLATSGSGLNESFLNLLGRGGRVSLFSGMPVASTRVELDLNLIHYQELVLAGAYGCAARHNAAAVALLAGGKMPFAELISHRFSLAETVAGVELTKTKEAFKVIVEV